jgi:uncharacterized protein YqeY
MSIKANIESDLKEALRAGDDVRKRALRTALASIKFAEIDKGSPLDDPGQIAMIQREIKSRYEAIADAQKANRPDLIAEGQAEIRILEKYLPQQLSQSELVQLAAAAVEEAQAKNVADMGKVMKLLMPRIQGRAPNDQVSQAVRQILQGS